MIKAAGLLLVFTASTIYGFARAAELSAAQRELAMLSAYFRQFALLLRSRRATTWEIVAALAGQKLFTKENFSVIIYKGVCGGGSFGEHLPEAIAACHPDNREILQGMLAGVGESIGIAELETQLSAIDLALLRLRQAENDARALCRTRCPMYRRLGVLGGILITVMLA